MAQLNCPHCQLASFGGPYPPFWHDPSATDSTGYTASRQPDRPPNANSPQVRPLAAPNARHYANGSKQVELQSPPNTAITPLTALTLSMVPTLILHLDSYISTSVRIPWGSDHQLKEAK